MEYRKAYFAGGCFWGVEDLFRLRKGIIDSEVGYMGGANEFPTYSNHEGHAEGIELTYDPELTSFSEILDYFFRIHNPTTINQQGNDIGTAYRSAIFVQDEVEKATAQNVIDIVDESGKWDNKIVTRLEPFEKFWPAEPEHQNYLTRYPDVYTCHFERFETFLK